MTATMNLEQMLELLARSAELHFPDLESKPVWNHALRDKKSFELLEGDCYTDGMILGVDYVPVIGDIEAYFDNRSDIEGVDLTTEPELKNQNSTAVIHAVVGIAYQRPRNRGDCDIQTIYQRFILQEKPSKVNITDSQITSLLKSL